MGSIITRYKKDQLFGSSRLSVINAACSHFSGVKGDDILHLKCTCVLNKSTLLHCKLYVCW